MPADRGSEPWNKGLSFINPEDKKIGFGIYLRRSTYRRINALCGGIKGQRSKLIEELVHLGAAVKYGSNWEELADTYAAMYGEDGMIMEHPANAKWPRYNKGSKRRKPNRLVER